MIRNPTSPASPTTGWSSIGAYTITGGKNKTVTWYAFDSSGNASTTINATTGLFTAPKIAGTYTIYAKSNQNNSIKSPNQQVVVVPPIVTASFEDGPTVDEVIITATGTDSAGYPLTYKWSTGETTQSITIPYYDGPDGNCVAMGGHLVTVSKSITVTITDSLGISASYTKTVMQGWICKGPFHPST